MLHRSEYSHAADCGSSVVRRVNHLNAGDRGGAARLLGQRYFERLARVRLQRAARGSADEEEIAKSLDCGMRTVERKLAVIRERWSAEGTP